MSRCVSGIATLLMLSACAASDPLPDTGPLIDASRPDANCEGDGCCRGRVGERCCVGLDPCAEGNFCPVIPANAFATCQRCEEPDVSCCYQHFQPRCPSGTSCQSGACEPIETTDTGTEDAGTEDAAVDDAS